MPIHRRLIFSLLLACLLAPGQPASNALAQSTSVHLALGNPSAAVTDPAQPLNYLIDRTQYALSYNRDQGRPNWVSWHLASADLGSAARSSAFTTDTSLPAGWPRVTTSDYTNSGYDRGHMCPSADRTAADLDNQATFILTNILPQAPDNNQGPWVDLENYSRSLVGQGDEVYIVSGGAGISATIAGGKVTVPTAVWKVILALPNGPDDLARVNTATRALAVWMPNQNGIRSAAWESFQTTIDAVEAATGYDFFSDLPVHVQQVIESRLDAPTRVVTLTATAGFSQTTPTGSAFLQHLQVRAVDANNQPVAGAAVTFAALGLGANALFAGGVFTATAITGPDGLAAAPILVANNLAGNFQVETSVSGMYTPVVFDLTNSLANLTPRLFLPLVVR